MWVYITVSSLERLDALISGQGGALVKAVDEHFVWALVLANLDEKMTWGTNHFHVNAHSTPDCSIYRTEGYWNSDFFFQNSVKIGAILYIVILQGSIQAKAIFEEE